MPRSPENANYTLLKSSRTEVDGVVKEKFKTILGWEGEISKC
jgi:hypothetical protein